jgi:hypothetical protein
MPVWKDDEKFSMNTLLVHILLYCFQRLSFGSTSASFGASPMRETCRAVYPGVYSQWNPCMKRRSEVHA